jgi:hypothetical protein
VSGVPSQLKSGISSADTRKQELLSAGIFHPRHFDMRLVCGTNFLLHESLVWVGKKSLAPPKFPVLFRSFSFVF